MAAFQYLLCKHGLPPQGWPTDDGLAIVGNGLIAASEAVFDATSYHHDAVVPIVPLAQSLRSLAFRRAMAGFIDIAGSTEGAGWTSPNVVNWSADRFSSEDAEIVAAKLYSEPIGERARDSERFAQRDLEPFHQ